MDCGVDSSGHGGRPVGERRRFWRPARQRRGRCAIAQPGAAKSVALRRPACAAGRVFCNRTAQHRRQRRRREDRSGAACSAMFEVPSEARWVSFSRPLESKRSAQASADHREGTMEARRGATAKPARCQARQRGPATPGDAKKMGAGSSDCSNPSMAHSLDR